MPLDGDLFLSIAGLFAISVVASIFVLWISGILISSSVSPGSIQAPVQVAQNTILLKNGIIADHDFHAADILADIEDWAGLRNWLSTRFSNLPEQLPTGEPNTQTYYANNNSNDPACVKITSKTSITRVVLNDTEISQPADKHQHIRQMATLKEDHNALTNSPYAIWRTDAEGNVLWQNDYCQRVLNEHLHDILKEMDTRSEPDSRNNSKIAINLGGEDLDTWFNVHTIVANNHNTYYAIDITGAVNAEVAKREFMQTLTKTFANLTTGLAIFDRNQQLALFNPALVDLTVLPVEFLSGRPNLMSFFDNLRDRQLMPEPKSYSDWRTQISAMIKTASDGLYKETWSLSSGATYRATGRPHPDGAVAFLFEDITAEISLTRRIRTQNDLRQSVMDNLEHAVAVIESNNVVLFCNATWTEIFGVDPDISFAELSIHDLVAICAQKFPHPEFWQSVEQKVTCKSLLHPIEETIETSVGDHLHCRLVPVAGGAALICRPFEQSTTRSLANAITT